VRRDRAVTASILAMVLSLVGAVLVSAVALVISGAFGALLTTLLVVVAVAVVLGLHPPLLTAIVNRVLRLARREPLPGPLPRVAVLRALGWSVLGSLALGVHAWLLARGLAGHRGAPVARSVGGFALAWLAGFVVPLAPAGGGVREVVLYATFTPFLGHNRAFALAAASRLLLTVVDLVTSGLAVALRPRPGDAPAHQSPPSPGQPPGVAPGGC
jgi:hypothetical protein